MTANALLSASRVFARLAVMETKINNSKGYGQKTAMQDAAYPKAVEQPNEVAHET